MLRYALIQDWDLADDGKFDTLRLLFATPKRWLEDRKVLKVERAPTAFGPVSVRVESKLGVGKVVAEVEFHPRKALKYRDFLGIERDNLANLPLEKSPPDAPKHTLLRIRVPDGWKIVSARNDIGQLKVDDQGTVELSRQMDKQTIEFKAVRE